MKFEVALPDELIRQLDNASNLDAVAPEMLKAAAPIAKAAIQRRVSVHNRTGDLEKSVTTRKPKKNKYDAYELDVVFSGKDRNGHPNPVKAAQIEYGGTHRNQPAQPFLQAAANDCAEEVSAAMQKKYEELMPHDN